MLTLACLAPTAAVLLQSRGRGGGRWTGGDRVSLSTLLLALVNSSLAFFLASFQVYCCCRDYEGFACTSGPLTLNCSRYLLRSKPRAAP